MPLSVILAWRGGTDDERVHGGVIPAESAAGDLCDHLVAGPFLEPESGDLLAGDRQRHVIIDPRNDAERDRGGVAGAAAEPRVDRGEPGTESAADPPRERARPREDLRHDRRGTVALQLDREVVDLPGHHPLRVHKLAIEQLQPSGNAPPGRGLISHRRTA